MRPFAEYSARPFVLWNIPFNRPAAMFFIVDVRFAIPDGPSDRAGAVFFFPNGAFAKWNSVFVIRDVPFDVWDAVFDRLKGTAECAANVVECVTRVWAAFLSDGEGIGGWITAAADHLPKDFDGAADFCSVVSAGRGSVAYREGVVMPNTFPPDREGELLPWSMVFRNHIVSMWAELGLTPEMVAQYSEKHERFAEAMRVMSAPETNSRVSRVRKNTLKWDLVDEIRLVARAINGFPGTTNTLRVAIGLPMRAETRQRILPPDEPPFMYVDEVRGHTIRVQLRGFNANNRAKPKGAQGALIYIFTGTESEPPDDLNLWHCIANTTRTRADIQVPGSISRGSPVWIVARWYSPTGKYSPLSRAILTGVGFGGPVLRRGVVA